MRIHWIVRLLCRFAFLLRGVIIGDLIMNYINIETLNLNAFRELYKLDKKFVGTSDYMGVAWFWGSNGTKHYLRDASIHQRKKIHKKWLDAGLDLHEDTERHYEIIKEVMKIKCSGSLSGRSV